MSMTIWLVLGLAVSTAAPAFAADREMEMGPPPPGYIKILGEAVPGWRPSDLLADSPGIWSPLGPRPILDEYWSGTDDASGRVVSLAPHPSDSNTLYAAAASGGIWKTTDGGALWTPLTDELSNLNHGCVALDPNNPETVYAGTGEYTTLAAGDGLFRSTDGGATWVRLATTAEVGTTCSRILVDPSSSQRIHVAGNLGYARSTDGGSTWSTLFAAVRGVSDLAMRAGDPNTLWLADHGTSTHAGGIWRSTDGGDSWTQLGGGLPTSGLRRIVLAAAPSSPDTVYTAIINSASGLLGLYRTVDGGNTWTLKPATPDFPLPQGWYDVFLGVDPTDPNKVYGGGVFPTYAVAGIVKSTDGGDTWVDITCTGGVGNCLSGPATPNVHPDMHAVAFGSDGTVWVGCDGGVWKTADEGASWINTNATLTVTQNYEVALNPADPAQVLGGTQDNGTVERQLDLEEWPQVLAGDGGFGAYDFDNPLRRYTTYVRLAVYRLFQGGATPISGPWQGERRNFIAPLVMDPNDAKTLLGGTYRVWRTLNADGAANWTPISGDLTGGNPATLNAIAVAVGDSETIFTGSSDGRVFVKSGPLTPWIDRSAGLPGGQISDLSIDPASSQRAYVAFHNTSGGRVFRTEDQGVTWQDVTGDMPPGVSARALAVDWRVEPPLLFSGSGVGVYVSVDGGTTWTKDGADLPNVNIGDLQIDTANDTITVGSYGRGAWRADLASFDPASIFADGFESGDTSAWSVTAP